MKTQIEKGLLLVLATVLFSVLGCQTTPTGGSELTPEGRTALDVSVRIAVRHALADSPRALEKAQNIRTVVTRLQSVITAESTLAALETEVSAEIDKLNLSPLDRADAQDLLRLFATALEARLGPDALNAQGLVRVNEFLLLVLVALPA